MIKYGATIDAFFPDFDFEKEVVVEVLPHDDDAAIPSGIMLQVFAELGIETYLMIVSGGQKGYSNICLRNRIAQVRQDETFDAYKILGVKRENISWLNFGDSELESQLYSWMHNGDLGFMPQAVSFLRTVGLNKNIRLFLPNEASAHPDHRAVFNQGSFAALQAQQPIWPEYGPPCAIKTILECPVWSPLPSNPTHAIKAPEEYAVKKRDAMQEYASQGAHIASVLEELEGRGPFEYFLEFNFPPMPADKYKQTFWEGTKC